MIVESAKVVYSGKIYKVYQRKQLMYDESYTTFESVKTRCSSKVICTKGDKILFTLQEQPHKQNPFYALIGGRIDDGEEPFDCAKRELLEESGMTSDNIFFYKSFPKYGFKSYSNFFVARDVYKIAEQNLDNGEKVEIIEKTFDEFIDFIIYKDVRVNREFVIEILKMKIDGKLDEFRKILFG